MEDTAESEASGELDRGLTSQQRQILQTKTEDVAGIGGWRYEVTDGTVFATEGTREILDVSVERFPLERVMKMFMEPGREPLEDAIQLCIEDGIPYELDLKLETVNGVKKYVRVKGEADEDTIGVLYGTLQDMTDDMVLRQRLSVLNRLLRHNVRNELNIVLGNTEELHGNSSTAGVAKAIEASANRLLSTADKARACDEVLSRSYENVELQLSRVLENLVDRLRKRYPRASIELDAPRTTVYADEEGIPVLFNEIIENAVEHHDGDEPQVSVEASRTDEGYVEVTVEDDGPGMREDQIEVLEQELESDLLHGNGIGIWTATWLTRRFRGTIDVETLERRGTRISVRLPDYSVRD